MDITRIPGSRIVTVARAAFATPGVDFLCFGESDQPSPEAAHTAAVAALADGVTRYPDVRGLPPLRESLAAYLTGLHAKPVDESRVQVTASGMAAVSIALAATVQAGQRVVIHNPLWPNIANAILLRGASVDALDLIATPDGRFRLDLDRLDRMMEGARAFVLNSPNNPTGWTATTEELRAILAMARRRGVWVISDEVYTRLVYDGAELPLETGIQRERESLLQVLASKDYAEGLAGGRIAQRHVLYLGEINDAQRAAWCKSIAVLEEGQPHSRQMAIFPEHRIAPELTCAVVHVKLDGMRLVRPRQWGACWLGMTLWEDLQLDAFLRPHLGCTREGTDWLLVLKTLVMYRLIDPGSEWRLHRQWFERSAMADLLGADEALAQPNTHRRGAGAPAAE